MRRQISGDEVEYLNALTPALNAAIAGAAKDAGVDFVDATEAFNGRELLCSGETFRETYLRPLQNRISLVPASFHPNAAGPREARRGGGEAPERALRTTRRGRCRGARSWRPPARPPRSPARCPSKGARARAPPASSASRAKCGRLSSARSVKGGIVIRPVTGTGQRAMKSPSSPGATPSLPSSPATFTCTSTSPAGVCSSRRRAESEASEWISRTFGATSLTLRLWSAPMKSQVKRSPMARLLLEQHLRAVLAHQLDAALRERRQVVRGHVLDRGADLHLGGHALANPLQVRAHARGVDHRGVKHRARLCRPGGR